MKNFKSAIGVLLFLTVAFSFYSFTVGGSSDVMASDINTNNDISETETYVSEEEKEEVLTSLLKLKEVNPNPTIEEINSFFAKANKDQVTCGSWTWAMVGCVKCYSRSNLKFRKMKSKRWCSDSSAPSGGYWQVIYWCDGRC